MTAAESSSSPPSVDIVDVHVAGEQTESTPVAGDFHLDPSLYPPPLDFKKASLLAGAITVVIMALSVSFAISHAPRAAVLRDDVPAAAAALHADGAPASFAEILDFEQQRPPSLWIVPCAAADDGGDEADPTGGRELARLRATPEHIFLAEVLGGTDAGSAMRQLREPEEWHRRSFGVDATRSFGVDGGGSMAEGAAAAPLSRISFGGAQVWLACQSRGALVAASPRRAAGHKSRDRGATLSLSLSLDSATGHVADALSRLEKRCTSASRVCRARCVEGSGASAVRFESEPPRQTPEVRRRVRVGFEASWERGVCEVEITGDDRSADRESTVLLELWRPSWGQRSQNRLVDVRSWGPVSADARRGPPILDSLLESMGM